MFDNLESVDFLQVERGPTLTRHLDNLIFEFITSEDEFMKLLNYPSATHKEQLPIQSPKLHSSRNPRVPIGIPHMESPPPSIRDSHNQDLQTLSSILSDTSVQSTELNPREQIAQTVLNDVSGGDSFNSISIPLQQRKIALYGLISIGKVPDLITEYEDSIVAKIAELYRIEIPLKDTILLPSYSIRVKLQETFTSHFSRNSTFYGTNSIANESQSASLRDFLCEELFGMPRVLATSLFHFIINPNEPSPSVDDLSEEHVFHCPEFIPTNIVVDAYRRHCRGKIHEKRFYNLFSDMGNQDNHISLARLAHILLNVLTSHSSYSFIEPCIYKCSFAVTAATRIFFDADIEGKWYLTYDTTYIRRGISPLSYLWTAQGAKSIVGDMGPLGYEAFYVLYCNFVKNSDNDIQGKVSEELMLQYNGGMYSKQFVQRLLNGQGRPLYKSYLDEPALSFVDFIIFMLAECAIDSYPAIKYFYNLADGDCDGLLSVDDIKTCLIVQAEKWSLYAIDLSVDELISQIIDIICFVPDDYEDPDTYGESLARQGFASGNLSRFNNIPRSVSSTGCATGLAFSFEQILRCAMPYNIFNAMFSIKRFLYFEQRDPYIGNLYGDINTKRPLRIPHTMSATWASFCLAAYDQFMEDGE